jgi:hydroxyethylthiazole kinase
MKNDHLLNLIDTIRVKRPLIHLLTNTVVENFTANAMLALGASPLCTHDPLDTKECALRADAILINIGTYDQLFLACIHAALEAACINKIPVVLDPVGCGFTEGRLSAALNILETYKITLVKGNASEIKSLAHGRLSQRGVDSNVSALSHKEIGELSKRLNCAVISTGEIDIICNKNVIAESRHGHKLMASVIGMGCVLGGIASALLAVTNDVFLAAHAAAAINGIAGEIAGSKSEQLGSFQSNFIDGLDNLQHYLAKI